MVQNGTPPGVTDKAGKGGERGGGDNKTLSEMKANEKA